jgi:hypothetical protein
MTGVNSLATFDFAAFFAAVDDARRDRDMGWYDLAAELVVGQFESSRPAISLSVQT